MAYQHRRDRVIQYVTQRYNEYYQRLLKDFKATEGEATWYRDVSVSDRDALRITSYVSQPEGYQPKRVVEVHYRNFEGRDPHTQMPHWSIHDSEVFSLDDYELAFAVFIYRLRNRPQDSTLLGALHDELYQPL